jgi:hypothetical protein
LSQRISACIELAEEQISKVASHELLLSTLFYFFLAENSLAQEEIIIYGTDRIEDSTIISYFENLRFDEIYSTVMFTARVITNKIQPRKNARLLKSAH